MNLDTLLCDYARQDLQRFCPAAHYWARDHNPIADRELTEPLRSRPMQFGLTPRERVAASALGDWATGRPTKSEAAQFWMLLALREIVAKRHPRPD